MSLFYDDELPAGFQDGDFEQRELEAQAARASALHRRGICTHSYRLGRVVPSFYSAEHIAGNLTVGRFGNRGGFVGEQSDIPEGKDLCLDCGELVEAWR